MRFHLGTIFLGILLLSISQFIYLYAGNSPEFNKNLIAKIHWEFGKMNDPVPSENTNNVSFNWDQSVLSDSGLQFSQFTDPTPPVADSIQTFCGPATVADLIANGSNIKWYDAATDGNLLSPSSPLSDGQQVYASQTVDGCESTLSKVVLIKILSIEIMPSRFDVCSGESVTLTINNNFSVNSSICNLDELPFRLREGLIDFWPFCGNANDISGLDNNGVVNGAILTTDRNGNEDNAYLFDGNGSFINTPINMTTSDSFSFSVSVRPETPETLYPQGYVGNMQSTLKNCVIHPVHGAVFGDAPLNAGSGLYVGSNGLMVIEHSDNYVKVALSHEINISDWINITIVYEDKSPKLYLDGEFVKIGEAGSRNVYPSTGNDNTQFRDYSNSGIGGGFSLSSQYFEGKIDNVMFWDRTLSDLEVKELQNSTNLIWSTGETTETITVTPTETTEYWVDVTTNGVTCREYITVTVTDAPEAPHCADDISECLANPAQTLTASAHPAPGQQVIWYDAEIGGNPVEDPSLQTVGSVTYYAEAIDLETGCSSVQRTPVTLTLTAGPEAPEAESIQTFCGPATVADLIANGSNIKWYDAATEGNLLSPSSPLSDGQQVYASQTVDGCEGEERQPVTLVILQAQITASTNEVCAGEDISLNFSSENFQNERKSIRNTQFPNPWPAGSAFNGGYINLGNFGVQNTFSISFWINPDQTQNPITVIFDASHGGSINWVLQSLNAGSTWGWGNLEFTLTPAVWQHVLLTYDNGVKSVYVNGTMISTINQIITYSGSPNLYLGNWPEGGRRFSGYIDELYITKDVITNPILNNHIELGEISSNAWGLFHFDEGEGLTSKNEVSGLNIDLGSWKWDNSVGLNTITWSTGETTENITVTPTETTEYWVDVTTNGVTCREYITINVLESPDAPSSDGDIEACAEDPIQTLTATATVGYGETIAWFDAPVSGNYIANPILDSIGTVTYYAEALDLETGCVSSERTPVTLTIGEACSDTYDGILSTSVSPNPVRDESLNIQLGGYSDEVARLTLYSVNGARITSQSKKLNDSKVVLDMSGYPNGIYILYIQLESESLRFKVVKE